jgi:glycosyltransferase involved in cell wall biosynthesis
MSELVVIVPTISTGSWLNKAVTSILLERDIDFSVVVINDGVQPDEQSGWCRDPRVSQMHNQRRSGLAFSLRRAIQSSDHPYIARLDSDDWNEANRLSIQVAKLAEDAGTVLVGTRAYKVDADGRRMGLMPSVASEDVRPVLRVRNSLIHSSVMFRRDAYERAGGYDARLRQMEDYDLWLRMAQYGRLLVTPEILVSYRVHGGQMSRKASPFTHYNRNIMLRQYSLGRYLGRGALASAASPAAWQIAQLLRYAGLRKIGYDKG